MYTLYLNGRSSEDVENSIIQDVGDDYRQEAARLSIYIKQKFPELIDVQNNGLHIEASPSGAVP